ncbi:uncharacterized protein LOC124261104 [Haliotis rubra]|uniref:uncharacterized protein LOC124261104 n=1 Tax=Haliotis rubra TaxID=36100 RepID=UPI001EE507A7|nr:uncharacterized protein LOC124261104 [Haliotis rubra]
MPRQDGRLSWDELVIIIAGFICQQFEDIFLRLRLHARQLVLHHLYGVNETSQEIHLSRSRMVPQQCTDTDVTTPLLDRLMWQEHTDLLRRTHLQMQIPRILLQQQQGCTGFRRLHNLVSAQEMATQTSPDQFGTVAEAPAEVTCPKTVTSGTAPAEESPAPAVVSPNAVSSQTATAPAAAAATTTAAGIAEVPGDQASSTKTQGDSGYSSSGRQDGDGAVSREPLPFRPGDTNNAAPKNSSDRNHASSGDGTTANNSDDEGRDDEEHG